MGVPTGASTASQKERLITIAIESGRFGVTQASVKPLVKEVNIKDSGELIVIEKFVERFKPPMAG